MFEMNPAAEENMCGGEDVAVPLVISNVVRQSPSIAFRSSLAFLSQYQNRAARATHHRSL